MYVGFLPQCLKENRILQIKILYQDKQKLWEEIGKPFFYF